MKSIYRIGEVSAICGVTPRTAAKWFDRGLLEGHWLPSSRRARGQRRVRGDSLLAFLRRQGLPLDRLLEADAPLEVLAVASDLLLLGQLKNFLPESARLHVTQSLFEAGVLSIRHVPQAVVYDLALGQAGARELIAGTRTLYPHAPPPLIALANEDDAEPQRLLSAGFAVVLKKPVAPDLLAARIQEARLAQAA